MAMHSALTRDVCILCAPSIRFSARVREGGRPEQRSYQTRSEVNTGENGPFGPELQQVSLRAAKIIFFALPK